MARTAQHRPLLMKREKLQRRVNYQADVSAQPPSLLCRLLIPPNIEKEDFVTALFARAQWFVSAAFPPAFTPHAARSSLDSPSRQPDSTEFSLREFDKSLRTHAESLTHFLMNEYCKWAERLCVLCIPPLSPAAPQHPSCLAHTRTLEQIAVLLCAGLSPCNLLECTNTE